jgi:SAM-dependent methyltransferase
MEESNAETARRKAALARFYGGLEAARDPSRRVGWESAAAHAMRLAAIAEATQPLGEVGSILDVGCGEAALLPVLRARGFKGRYRGEDLRNAPLAHARLGEGDEVVEVDAFALERCERADVVVCSGTLNTDSGAATPFREVEAAIMSMWTRANRLLVFDLAVSDRHAPGVGLVASELAAVHAVCRKLASVVSVREDVIPGEALFVLERSRLRAFRKRGLPPLVLAENLLLANEPRACIDVLTVLGDEARVGQGALLLGRAASALGELERAFESLERAARDDGLRVFATLAQAPVLARLAVFHQP